MPTLCGVGLADRHEHRVQIAERKAFDVGKLAVAEDIERGRQAFGDLRVADFERARPGLARPAATPQGFAQRRRAVGGLDRFELRAQLAAVVGERLLDPGACRKS